MFTDTDSLTYEIEAEDVYKEFWNDKDMFDNSDYPESSPYHCNVNKKIIGKFKDEACGIPITEFIGLKSKMYSYVKDNEKGGKTAKGIKKNITKNNIKHEDYKNTLINNEQMHHKMKTIRSQRHQLGSDEIKYPSAASMTSATSMIMEQAVMPMGTTKYNHRHQSFYQTYRPPYIWTRYQFSLLLQNIGLHFWTRYDFLK